MSDTAIDTVETTDPELVLAQNQIRLMEGTIASLRSVEEYHREALRDTRTQRERAERNLTFWRKKVQRVQP